MKDKHLLIVGLGNSGKDYENTRHNVGADLVSFLSEEWDIELKENKKLSGLIGSSKMGSKKVTLFLPKGYMNNSGKPVKKVVDYLKIELPNLLVIHDELDLPLGVIKFKNSGGHGGHNGLRDIIRGLGDNKDFIRLRVGIAHPGKSKDVTNYVLAKPSKKDKELLKEKMKASINSLEIYLNEGLEKATLNLHS
mgnify:FL=1|tara:strand:- start:183 stop:761 length:579 start_codon:yes stop_codon:yes gene_type:complete